MNNKINLMAFCVALSPFNYLYTMKRSHEQQQNYPKKLDKSEPISISPRKNPTDRIITISPTDHLFWDWQNSSSPQRLSSNGNSLK